MKINFNHKNDFKHICLNAISCVDMNMFVYMRLPCSNKNAEKGYVILTRKYSPSYNALVPNRVRGAVFDPVGSFDINIRGDPYCVPLPHKMPKLI
jgi:hypothetical protein